MTDRRFMLPESLKSATDIIDAYDAEVRTDKRKSNIGWPLERHLYRDLPPELGDEAWERILAIADKKQWGDRKDGKLTAGAEDVLRRAWAAYRGALRTLDRDRQLG